MSFPFVLTDMAQWRWVRWDEAERKGKGFIPRGAAHAEEKEEEAAVETNPGAVVKGVSRSGMFCSYGR